MLYDVEPQVSGDLPQITAPLAWTVDGQWALLPRADQGLLRVDGWESSAVWFSVVVLNINVLSCISTKRHKSLSLRALFVGLIA